MRKIELLSPARTADIGIEAIRHGADAVYIGARSFGARAAAGNSVEDIARLVTFAHQYKARVYVTVNTIIYDQELRDVEELIHQLWQVHVDALIIQDLRILSLHLPPIPLHASTQMDNRTVEKVQSLARLGFPQVVLARELTTDEISEIHRACPDTELEVFVHGALCVGLSGRCNASEYMFGRSANRGECAQVCRMPFDLVARQSDGGEEHVLMRNRHLLSLRDNCQIRNLEALLESGASSLKIEGRLKDVDYVKNVTAAYSAALDAVIAKHPDEYCRASAGHVRYTFNADVEKSFNRGFVRNVSKPDANLDTPKSMGEYVGKTKEVFTNHITVATQKQISNGDGLCYINNRGELVGFRVNKVEGGKLYPLEMPRNLARGTVLYRNQDTAFDRLLQRPSAERRIWVDIAIDETEQGFRLTMTDEDSIVATLDVCAEKELARTHQTENIQRQLSKLGDTVFEARTVQLNYRKNWFVPSSLLADWRRTLSQMLLEERMKYYPQQECAHTPQQIETETPFELSHDTSTPLMQTKYCLRRQLGMCLKEKLHSPAENLFLRMKNGKELRLLFDCKQCMMKVFAMITLLLMLTGCVGGNTEMGTTIASDTDTVVTIVNAIDTVQVEQDSTLTNLSPAQVDSLVFRLSHHYSENFNFLVKADSLMLLPREGDIIQDTCYVYGGDLIAVASISQQSDTVWVKVAHDQFTMGWIAEPILLQGVVPDDPISEMLDMLSGSRGIWMSVLVAIGIVAYLLQQGKKRRLQLLKFGEMDSPYPFLFLSLIAVMATVYASVQNFVPEFWQEYYFHPSLNPLVLPPIMSVLVVLVWLLIISFLAVCDEVYHHFYFLPGVAYMIELLSLGMVVYLIISWTTLYYIGYGILPAFLVGCWWGYARKVNTTNK